MSLITPDIGLIFWMVVIFGVVFFILAKFGFPVITSSVEKRSNHIRDSLAAAEQARLSVEEAALKRQQMLEETRTEQGRILREASRERDAIIAEGQQKARDEASEILRSARAEIASEKEEAEREIRAQVSALSLAVAEKVMRKELESDQEQLSLLERYSEEASEAQMS
ncbi:MAG: F0F1 ATP synthase subunit B [Bacteroidales bacterium]|nr:F0F1 ATP synthase subunit B [Bacteroidales bacterium]